MIAYSLLFVACAPHATPLEAAGDARPAADPRETLVTATQSKDPAIRSLALSALVGADGAHPWATHAAQDEASEVWESVVPALLGSPSGTEVVLRWVETTPIDSPGLAITLWALGPAAGSRASTLWPRPEEPWQQAPLAVAAARSGDVDAVAFLDRWLRTGDIPWDTVLFQHVGHTGSPALIPALLAAEQRSEPEVKASLAAARWALGDRSAEATLSRTLDVGDELQRVSLVETLLALDGARPLLAHAARGTDDAARLASLSLDPDPDAFVAALAVGDDDVVEIAVDHLWVWSTRWGRRAQRQICESALAGAESGTTRVRAAWVDWLTRCGKEGESALARLLGDESQRVRTVAAAAIIGSQTPSQTAPPP